MNKRKKPHKTFYVTEDVIELDDSGVRSYSPNTDKGYSIKIANTGDPVEILFNDGIGLLCLFPKTKQIAYLGHSKVKCNET